MFNTKYCKECGLLPMSQLLQRLYHMSGREGIQPRGGLVQQTHRRIRQ